MRTLKFSKLYLLSHKERSALAVSFSDGTNLVIGNNQSGKSAIMKSLYEALGAKPHRIDATWKSAQVTVAVEFYVDNRRYTAIKIGTSYTIFSDLDVRIFQTTSVSSELAPFIAELLDFRLVMLDQRENTVIPPPSYAFAPYYVDQDEGWSKPWKSFQDMYLPNSSRSLADYHSGIRPNEYYGAQVQRDRKRTEMRDLAVRRETFSETLRQLSELGQNADISYEMESFAAETDRLLEVSARLQREEREHRERVFDINEEHQLWREQANLLRSALTEMEQNLHAAVDLPHSVECPTCGQIYLNSIVEQFGLVAEKDGLLSSLLVANEHAAATATRLAEARNDLAQIQVGISEARAILDIEKSGITFREIIAVEGRTEAAKFVQEKISGLDSEIGKCVEEINALEESMAESISTSRSRSIRDYFYAQLAAYLTKLDVARDEDGTNSIHSIKLARGSEGPRGLAAYYIAFVQTAAAHGDSAKCALVIDGPNQQGQDSTHMPQIMRFLVDQRPPNIQQIVAVEDYYGIDPSEVSVIQLGGESRKVLRSSEYDAVSAILAPFLQQIA